MAVASVKAQIQGNGVNAYWWNGVNNFGDLITPFLLERYNYTPLLSKPMESELVATGSILQQIPETFPGVVLGSGLISEQNRRFSRARILCVRGELTRRCLGLKEQIPLGDPGLMLSGFVNRSRTDVEVGVVPHYVDLDSAKVKMLLSYFGNNAKLIDVRRPPDIVAKNISRCGLIISSSLHGVIVAHSFSIPAVWLVLGNLVKGGGFKFHDYASSVDISLTPYAVQGGAGFGDFEKFCSLPSGSVLNNRIAMLNDLFRGLSTKLRGEHL